MEDEVKGFAMLGKEKGMKGALVSLTVWSQKVRVICYCYQT